MNALDKIASLTITFIFLLILGVVALGGEIPVTVTCQAVGGCKEVSPFGAIVFEFSRPVQPHLAEKLWQTFPTTPGEWEWSDDRHALWKSKSPLPSNQKIELQFDAGLAGKNGEKIPANTHWEVTVRSPRIIGVKSDKKGKEIFSFGMDTEIPALQLTHSDGHIYDYDPSPDGERIVFSSTNEMNGLDLWMVRRDGSDQAILLDCGADRCSAPAWSPIAMEIAFTRESAGLELEGPRGAPRIWIVDIKTKQTAPLFTDPQQVGYGVNWSPDGQWLSIWDGTNGGIKVVNRQSGDTFMLESNNGDRGCWTPDSHYLYHSKSILGETGYLNVLLRADIINGTTSTLLGGSEEGGEMSVDFPVCNPIVDWIVVTIQPQRKNPDKELVLLSSDSQGGIVIIDEPSQIPSLYSWTSDGQLLVFQVFRLGRKSQYEETWVWDWGTGLAKKISDEYSFPRWLP